MDQVLDELGLQQLDGLATAAAAPDGRAGMGEERGDGSEQEEDDLRARLDRLKKDDD